MGYRARGDAIRSLSREMGSITEETDGGVLQRKEPTPTAVPLVKSLGNEMPGNVCTCNPRAADGAGHVRQR